MVKGKSYKIDYKYNLRTYLGFLKRYKGILILLLVLILFLEASYVADKFLFKMIIDNGAEFAVGVLGRGVFVQILLIVAGVYIGLTIFRSLGTLLRVAMINKLEGKLIVDLKRKYFNHILNLSHNFHVSHKTGSLISRLVRSGGAMERMTDVIIFNFVPLFFQLIIAFTSIVYFSLVPALVIILTAVVFISYNLFIQQIQKKSFIFTNKTEDIEKGSIADIFTNIDSIKYFGKEKVVAGKFVKLSEKTKNAFLRTWNYFKWLGFGETLILGIGTFFLIYFPMLNFLAGEITIGTVVFIYTVYTGLIGSLFGFVHGIRGYYRSMADFQDLFQYGKIENEIKNKPGAKELKVRAGEIEFKNVDFAFARRKLFDKFNMKINKNQKIAFVGHSGSGKTTLVKLLYRLYDVDAGGILIDGNDIKDVKKDSLRNEMSVVPQEAILFDDTVFNNVRFSNPSASREEVLAAMKFAQLDKIVENFPKGARTIVGERGVKLSGGEKQRVSIARALLANKKILVLDEATSSLDSETEHEIQKDLERLMEGRTVIIIAHRLSTIMKADKIVVLDRGRIVQVGSHNKLIKQVGQYKRLWDLQKGGYIK